MKKKFEDGLRAATKDFGLSDKALKELVEKGLTLIGDNTMEDEVKSQVDLFVNIARAMQGEVTRKVQQAMDSQKKSPEEEEEEDKTKKAKQEKKDSDLLEELKSLRKEMAEIRKASKEAEAAKLEAERLKMVKEAAQKAGIGDDLYEIMDKSTIKTAKDAEAFFAKAKQALVNDKLPQKGAGGTQTTPASEAEKAAAEAWAQSLPSKK